MESPVRIRVPPLKKVLQTEEKLGILTVLPQPFVNSPLRKPDKEALLVEWRHEAGRIDLTLKHRGLESAEERTFFGLIRHVSRPCEPLGSLLSFFGSYDH